jgi:hypothetical protein
MLLSIALIGTATAVLRNGILDSKSESDESPVPIEVQDVLCGCYDDTVGILDSLIHISTYLRGLDNSPSALGTSLIELHQLVDVRNRIETDVKRMYLETPEWLVLCLVYTNTLRQGQFYDCWTRPETLSPSEGKVRELSTTDEKLVLYTHHDAMEGFGKTILAKRRALIRRCSFGKIPK